MTDNTGLASTTTSAIDVAAAGPPLNFQGLWWNAPAESESGWGINFAHQGDVIFATWFTYDASGKAWWLSMTADADRSEYVHRDSVPDDRAPLQRGSVRPGAGAGARPWASRR